MHGSPLDAEQVKATKRELGYPSEEPFFLPDDAVGHLREAVERGRAAEAAWNGRLDAYRKAHPELAAELERRLAGELPKGWDQDLPTFTTDDKPIATRAAGGKAINAIARARARAARRFGRPQPLDGHRAQGAGRLPEPGAHARDDRRARWAAAGATRAATSTSACASTRWASMCSGMALHGGVIPFCATFFIFADYMRPAIRLASIMQVHSIFVFTHDSIGVGEDGPTHQPVEQAGVAARDPEAAR